MVLKKSNDNNMNTIYNSILQLLKKCILAGFLLLVTTTIFTGCKKFLDEKPVKSQTIPTTLNDLNKLLDNLTSMNSSSPSGIAELITDNFYLTTADWQFWMGIGVVNETSNYIWDANATPYNNAWNLPYQSPIYYANIVLDVLPTIKKEAGSENEYNYLKGAALFYRAFIFHQLAQLYCKPFSSQNANEPGIVLRITANVSEKSTRATVQETYDQIIADLKNAADILPLSTTVSSRPTKAAAYAALARTYLSMNDYANSGMYADKSLQLKNDLMDFNNLIPIGSSPITMFNDEVIFHSTTSPPILTSSSYAKIDSTLYQSYNVNDLRKKVFFAENSGPNTGTYRFIGSYWGTFSTGRVFDGLTTDEMYLIRAECFARAGNIPNAMADLNTLMQKRWNSVNWTPFTATDASDALSKILTERRKELVFRGLRWSDIRRFNLEGANITLKRIINNTVYNLSPNDLRSALLIPWDEINRSGIAQNPR